MTSERRCSKAACGRPAAATLTYVYRDSTVVVGALVAIAEPHAYDLCETHAEGFVAPRGWDVVHIHQEFADMPPSSDDIDALARAVREAGRPVEPDPDRPHQPVQESEPRRGHLRVVSSEG